MIGAAVEVWQRTFYFGSLRVKLILARLGMPKWVWPSMNQYRMFFVHTSTPTPIIYQKLTKHANYCMQNNQLTTKLLAEWMENFIGEIEVPHIATPLFDHALPIKHLPKLLLMSHISWRCLVYAAHCYFVLCVFLVRPSARGNMGNCGHLSWKSANDTCNSWEYITWHARALAPCAWLLLEGRPPTCSPNMLLLGFIKFQLRIHEWCQLLRKHEQLEL